MANGTSTPGGLSFPRETFARLTPAPFLQAHLKQSSPIRPNGRKPEEWQTPVINTGSLTHSNGSAVVRVGDTAVVCGIRAEVLLAADVPQPPKEDADPHDLIADLGLVVPNVELSTGCSPAHLPGNAPGTLAQSLSHRVLSLLRVANILRSEDLCITHVLPPTDEDGPDAQPQTVTKAYWTLYLDILCIALDGNPFDAIWAAVLASLRDTVLPRAWWDPEREMILCSPLTSEAKKLQLSDLPIAATFAVFSTASAFKQRHDAESWVLVDPDGFEEEICNESLTVVLRVDQMGKVHVLRLEKSGGTEIDLATMRQCVEKAKDRFAQWTSALKNV
nr:exosome complex component rrp43 [Quercus suber]